ncbi:hypothetical protein BGZ75_005224 [Mortierella antarctica]|nr:hypothetical protein BGZ75_005224 [Mortierella antarctica]
MTVSLAIHPLSLPEIRERIGRYLSIKDALSCVQVSKDWAKDFARPIWHTVHLEAQRQFVELDPEVIQKYRHHISVVTHLSNLAHLQLLQSSPSPLPQSGKWLSCLTVLSGTVKSEDQGLCNDLIARNIRSITKVVLQREYSSADGAEEDYSLETLSPVEALVPHPTTGVVVVPALTSRLTTLKLERYRMQRETLCMLLRGCPALETLGLLRTRIFQRLRHDNTKEEFQHTRIRYFAVDAENLLLPIPTTTAAAAVADAPANMPVPVQSLMQRTRPSLLAHFPALTTLGIDANSESELQVPEFRSEIARWCPHLRGLDCYGWILSIILVNNSLETIRSVSFNHGGILAKLVLALLNHEDTLTSVSTHSNDTWGSAADETDRGWKEEEMIASALLAAAPDRFIASHADSIWMVYMIPRQCPKIERMCFPKYMMDMDEIEKVPWACEGLRDLRVRIKGLDTADKIQTVLSTWVTRRRLHKLEQKRKADEETVKPTIEDTAAAAAAESSSDTDGTAKDIRTAAAETSSENTIDPAIGNSDTAAGDNIIEASAVEITAIGAASAENNTPESASDLQDTVKVALPLEERVVRHLLQFDNLTTVWLGYGIFRV